MERRRYKRGLPPALPAALILMLIATTAAAASPSDLFAALRAAPTDTDLPLGTPGDTASIAHGLRPVPTYPTLRLDAREPRDSQEPVAPVEPLQPVPFADATAFEMLVRQTLGRPLPAFGAELFSGNSQGFEPVEQASVPADFVLGPGDEVYIRAWGSVDIDYRATIDRGGAITIPKVGSRIFASTFAQPSRALFMASISVSASASCVQFASM
jgi:hypothetical protein